MRSDTASFQLRWFVVLSAWLVLMPLGLVVVRMWLPSDALPVLEASSAFVDDALRVSPPHPVNGILDGDRVVSVNGQGVGDLLADPVARSIERGDVVQLVVERNGQRRVVAVTVGAHRQFGALLADLWPLLVATSLILMTCALVGLVLEPSLNVLVDVAGVGVEAGQRHGRADLDLGVGEAQGV